VSGHTVRMLVSNRRSSSKSSVEFHTVRMLVSNRRSSSKSSAALVIKRGLHPFESFPLTKAVARHAFLRPPNRNPRQGLSATQEPTRRGDYFECRARATTRVVAPPPAPARWFSDRPSLPGGGWGLVSNSAAALL
jgi:hypothetical protein